MSGAASNLTDLAAALTEQSQLVDSTGTVVQDAPCRKCAYNVRGLNTSGRCPECGTPVGLSVHGNLLRFSDPNWLEAVARGAFLILWGLLAAIIGAILATVLQAMGSRLLNEFVVFAASLVTIYGAWLLTTPDPSGIGEEQYGTSRKLIRAGLVAGLAKNLITIVSSNSTLPNTIEISLMILDFVAGILGLIGQLAMLVYLRKLAMRIPDPEIAQRARVVLYGYGISLGIGTVIEALRALLTYAGLMFSGFAAVHVLSGIAGIAFLIYGVMYLFLLYRIGKAVRLQTTIAWATWAVPAAVKRVAPN